MAEFYSGNFYLNDAQMEVNARYIYNYLGSRGWTINAIAGMLGNMQTESSINPAIWESLDAGNFDAGFGLVQWTPATKYTNWCASRGLDPSHMDSALQRIEWELDNGEQYYATDAYPESFAQFKKSTKSPYYLALAFLANYERPADPDQPERGRQAERWYEFLTGEPAPESPPDGDLIKRKRLSLLLMWAATRRK